MPPKNENVNAPAGNEFVITRTYQAPRALIFKVFSQAEHLAKWWGPAGFTMAHVSLKFHSGGMFLYCMQSPEGMEMWGKFVYRDIIEPELIVFVSSFSDADGNNIRAPFMPVWPLEVLNILTLEEHNGTTTLTLRGGPINATPEEHSAFTGMHANMQQGFKGTFDQLETYLSSLQHTSH